MKPWELLLVELSDGSRFRLTCTPVGCVGVPRDRRAASLVLRVAAVSEVQCPDCQAAVIAIDEPVLGRMLLDAEPKQRYIIALGGHDAGTPYSVPTYSVHACEPPKNEAGETVEECRHCGCVYGVSR